MRRLTRLLVPALLVAAAVAAVPAPAQAGTFFFPAGVPANTPNDPLPQARAAVISDPGIVVQTGDVLDIAVSGTASGGPNFPFYDANGVPGQFFPSDGEFPRIVGAPAQAYSLIATIVPTGSDAHLSGVGDEWFLVGTASSITATRAGRLLFATNDALYRPFWVSAYTDNSGGFDVTFLETDGDGDNDGILNDVDNCPEDANTDQGDVDGDGLGDACDPRDDRPQDADLDGVLDVNDNCPTVANADQANLDQDGIGDACDGDRDGDGVGNAVDNCPDVANAGQADLDQDGIGDACDGDRDGDTIANPADNCPIVPNADQADLDRDGTGDACDPTPGSTPGKVTGGGWITDAKNNFGFNARYDAGAAAPSGQLTYQDKQAGVRIKATSITLVAISGTHATILGSADVNGTPTDFRVDVDDLGEPGRSDTFRIVAGAYSAGGTLNGGNIQIHG